MRIVTLAAAGLSAALALTACTETKSPSASSPASAVEAAPATSALSATDELKAAVAKTTATTTRFTITSDLGGTGSSTGTGSADATAKSSQYHAQITVQGQQLTIDSVQVGTDLYVKMPGILPGDPAKWSHVDTTKVKSLAKLGLDNQGNPTNLAAFDASLVSAKKVGPDSFEGVLDGTKNPALAGVAAESLGDAVKAMPFEAKVDGDGRLTSLTNHTPASGTVPATKTTIEFTGFGAPVSITKPAAGEVQEIPADLYAALG